MKNDERKENRVLIVDRSPIVRKRLENILAEHGCEVAGTAQTAEDAMEIYRKLRPDIVALDISVTSDCVSFIRRFQKLYPDAKIVMTSILGRKEMISDGIRAGAMDFILKPFVPERVVDVMKGISDRPA